MSLSQRFVVRRHHRTPLVVLGSALALFACVIQMGHAIHASGQGGESTLATAPIDRAAFLAPPMDVRPSIRWWWPGGDVDDAELARELSLMHDAGFGSAEIQSFAVGLPPDASSAVNTYGTPTWFDHVASALDRAQALGMTLDLTLGSSWPPASTDIGAAQSLRQLTVTGQFVQGPRLLDEPVPAAVEPLSYPLANTLLKFPDTYDKSKMTLVTVLGARRDANQTQDLGPGTPAVTGLPNLPDTVYLEASSVITLTPYLTSNGRLQWPVPAGDWMVFALYEGPTGSRPFYDANFGTALVVDHFNGNAVLAGLQSLAQSAADRLGSRFGSSLQSLFVDSVELRTELYWTDDLLNEFAARRGYRVEAFLPVLFRPLADDAYLNKVYLNAPPTYEIRGVGPRVRQDYDQTIAELMVERFFEPLREWSEAHNVKARVQAHGAPVDLLNAYAQASIPETEGLYGGGRPAFLKFAVSAAHSAGHAITSSEILAFKGGVASPTAMLQEANKHLAAGVNRLVFHGFPYVYEAGFTFPGWMPFQSPYLPGANIIGTFGSPLNDRNPLWPYMRSTTDYLGRAQLVLRTGSPVAEVAVYSGRLGYPDDSNFNPPVPAALAATGYNFDYVNGDLLQGALVSANALQVGANQYGALIVPDGSPMPLAVANRIANLAASGLPVLMVGDIPHASVGLQDFINNQDGVVQSRFEQVLGTTRERLPTDGTLRSGSAMFVSSANRLGAALSNDFHLAPGIKIADQTHDIAYTHRHSSSADYYFLASPSNSAFDVHCTFPNPDSRIPEIWDLWGGKVFPAPVYSDTGTEIDVLLHFEPGRAIVVGFDRAGTAVHIDAGSSLPGVYRTDSGDLAGLADAPGSYMVVLNGGVSQIVTAAGPALASIGLPTWDIVVGTGDAAGNSGTQAFQRSALMDLSTVEGYSGNAIYTAFLDFTNLNPAYQSQNVRLLLDLGRVADVAEVRVNDKGLAATMLTAPYTVDITDFLVLGLNKFKVTIATTPGQAPAGLLGPVTLVPRYRVAVPGFKPLQMSMVITPTNFPNNTEEDMIAAIGQAAPFVHHVNFQWFWRTPPNNANPNGGAVVECAQATLWVQEARRLNLTVTLQFQSFYAQVQGSYERALNSATQGGMLPVVRVASPLAPFETASFADRGLASAYLNQISCLAALKPEYLVLGPEVNFVNIFNHAEWINFIPVYSQAYELAKTISPTTQVGLSFQYDGLRRDLLVHGDDWSILTTGPRRDFIALTTYYGFSDDRNAEFPNPSLIPDDYYAPIRQVLGPGMPVIFTEVGWSSFYQNGLRTQADFIRRMPMLLGIAHPDNITWALQHDVQYFEGPGTSLNQSGLLTSTGAPKPAWDQAMIFKREGVLTNVVPHVYQPAPVPFSVTAVPPNFPLQFSRETGFQAIATASEVSQHVSLQFSWKDQVTGLVWNCEDIRPYVEEAQRRGLRYTIQFNTYAAMPASNPNANPNVILLNPIQPPVNDHDVGPSFANPEIRDAYLTQVGCLASLKPDYLVLGPELNFLVASRYEEFKRFSAVYQAAYQIAKAAYPSTQVGVSWQYDAVRRNLAQGSPEGYVEQLGPQDFIGLTTYFSYSVGNVSQYPWPLSVPIDYYQPIRPRWGAKTPIVFTEVGWSSAFPNGQMNQALFLNRLLLLLSAVRPANVIWGLQHDVVNYFPGEIAGLNQLGLRSVDGTPKPGWAQALWLKDQGLLITAPSTQP